MRVFHITTNYPTRDHPIFGIFVKEQVASLEALGVECDVLYCDRKGHGTWMYLTYIPVIWRRILRGRYDVIHCHHVLSAAKLRAKISSCNFRSASSVDNPGFVILYCHSDRIVPDIEAVFRHCSFVTEKGLLKRILAFQSTRSPAVPDNHIAASFNRCRFVNKPAVRSDTGLFWMPHKTPQTRPEQYLMRFVKSSIEASNVCSVIGDKDGETCGTLEFKACDIRTDGELFVRRYNPGAGNLHIRAIASVMQCSGKYVTTETIEARRTSFVSDFVSEMEMTKSNL